MWSNAGASAPAVLSTWARTASGSPAACAFVAGTPTGTGPLAEGTASAYWAIAASDGSVGGGPSAVAGDATTTAKPAAKVAARSIRIDMDREYDNKS
jgi:hypothetical protein